MEMLIEGGIPSNIFDGLLRIGGQHKFNSQTEAEFANCIMADTDACLTYQSFGMSLLFHS
jgi:hypothetical protein